jgi:hypothetical protein
MQTRLSKLNRAALCLGMLLMASFAVPTQAGNWYRGNDADCDDECPPQRQRCRWCQGRGCLCCRGNGGAGWFGGGRFVPVNGNYCDPRDQRLYSAQGFNVPVTVPLAPVCRSYNYGWGIPSVRLSQAGGYRAWLPDQPFSQSGGRLPGGLYPVIYHPTDTTQLGYFYNYVPTWQRRQW